MKKKKKGATARQCASFVHSDSNYSFRAFVRSRTTTGERESISVVYIYTPRVWYYVRAFVNETELEEEEEFRVHSFIHSFIPVEKKSPSAAAAVVVVLVSG